MQNDPRQLDGLTGSAPDRNALDRPRRARLRELLGRAPDPVASRELLAVLTDPGNPDNRWLASKLCLDSDLQNRPLRELLPGLGLVESPRFSVRLSVRAANSLIRAEAATLTALAGMSVAQLVALPNLGMATVEETLLVVLDEWASSYLASVEGHSAEQTVADQVPAGAANRGSEQKTLSELAEAFSEIESVAAFFAFRRRQLDPDQPAQSVVAGELGVSGSRVSRQESKVRTLLSKLMQDGDSPIASAVVSIQERLGSVALKRELDDALVSLDPSEAVLSGDVPHRRALLLQLLDYTISGEWAVGPDIEVLTTAVLNCLTEGGSADVDIVGRHLGHLGIREPLRVPWVICQARFEIAEGKVLRRT